MSEEKKNYTAKTATAYRSQAKSRVTTLCRLRESVMTRFLNATGKDDELAKVFDSLVSKYDDLIEEERTTFTYFCKRIDTANRE